MDQFYRIYIKNYNYERMIVYLLTINHNNKFNNKAKTILINNNNNNKIIKMKVLY